MARPKKKGLSYFPFDIDFFEDNKIRILKARYKSDGIFMYIFLLTEIYRSDNGYYIQVDDDFEYILSEQLFMDVTKVKQVLNFLLKRSLFNDKLFSVDKVLTSAGIQRRWQLAKKESARKSPIEVGRYWLLSEEETEPFIKCSLFEINTGKTHSYSGKNSDNSAKKPIKESKVNNNIYFASPELDLIFGLYVMSRRQNGDNLTDEQIALLKEELVSLSQNETEQIAIVKKATMSGWKSFYPLSKKKKTDGLPQWKKPDNKFKNFEERKYDMADLEKQILGKQSEEKKGC